MAFKLPPLNTLRFFESAGRLLSFKLAARELAVTPSAVSHGIQALEDWLGTALFSRSSRGLTLTEAGQAYLPATRQALTILAAASERVPGRPPRRKLSISVAPTFGTRLLLPRLAEFSQLHPGINVVIDTAHRHVEFPRDGVDVAIRLGHGGWPDLVSTRLLTEELVPVCSPDLLRKLGPQPKLCDSPLIHLTSASDDWSSWAAGAGRAIPSCERRLMVDTIQLALDAAARGLGIAIGRLPLALPELESGRLVRFCEPAVAARSAYWLVGAAETMAQSEIIAFRDWLIATLSSQKLQPAGVTRNSLPGRPEPDITG